MRLFDVDPDKKNTQQDIPVFPLPLEMEPSLFMRIGDKQKISTDGQTREDYFFAPLPFRYNTGTMNVNTYLNAEKLSPQELYNFLINPINLFGYRFLVNIVTFLWMYNGLRYSSIEEVDLGKPYDFIIVGGGTAGSILATRLSELQQFRILLLEAGGVESQLTDVPYLSHVWRDSKLDWKVTSTPQETSCLAYLNKSCTLSSGKGIGGSSLISSMTYLRGNPDDFDRWEREYSATGWSWNEVFPYFIKSEDFTDVREGDFSSKFHRSGGPLPVQYQKYDPPFVKPFLSSAELRGYSIGDYNGESQLKFNKVQSVKSRGRRISIKKAFLDKAKNRPNLHVITFSHVTRVLFDRNRRAVGVEYVRENKVHRVFSINEVILSAGVFRSPQLLLLSGIGHSDELNRTSIQQIANLPGVGKNLHDHVYSLLHFSVNSSETMIPSRVNQASNYALLINEGRGPLSSSGEVGHGFIRTKHAKNTTSAADVKLTYFAMSPMSFQEDDFWRSAYGFRRSIWNKYFKPYYNEETTTLSVGLMKPKSRGRLTIRSDNPLDDPAIDPSYFSHPEDTLVMLEGIRHGTYLGTSYAFYSFNPVLNPNHFPGCESFEIWTEDYIKCYMKTYTVPGDNFVGTCRMGNDSDPLAVVDRKLNVLGGVSRLRVVDASVIPEIPSGDIFASVVMIAERAADLIKADYS